MARDCQECITASGNECILYSGDTYLDCALVQNTWYKIDDLITKLACAASQGTTTSTTTTTTTTVMYQVATVDQNAVGVTLFFQPGELANTPGSGSIVNLHNGIYDVYIMNTSIVGKYIVMRDALSAGNIISYLPAQYVQSFSVPAVRNITITTVAPP